MGLPARPGAAGCATLPVGPAAARGNSPASGFRPPYGRRTSGFTLIELLVVLALIGIVTVAAVPSFQSFLDRTRTDAAAAEVASLLSFARSEAIRRNAPVTICRTTAVDNTVCAQNAQSDWSTRWMVFQDTDGDLARAATEDITRVRDPLNGSLAMSLGTGPMQAIQFTSRGFLQADTALSFDLSSASSDHRTVHVCLSRAGRITQGTAVC